MKCPIDGTELKITDRQGVEIDYCPQCRGVWLDRGELDKIIERADKYDARDRARDDDDDDEPRRRSSRSGGGMGGIAGIVGEVLKEKSGRSDERYRDERYRDERYRDERYRDERYRDERYRDERYRDERYRDGSYRKKKKGGILGELFDF